MDRENKGLYWQLREYVSTDAYPLHMPGHKRREDMFPMREFTNPYAVDITEIEGFDNLHHATGILRDCMEHAALVYGTRRSYFLVNGSSAGILAAVSASVPPNASICMARNCHKAAYHSVFLRNLDVEYSYPQICEDLGIQGGISPETVDNSLQKMLEEGRKPKAVLVVSPTYDGMVSDIAEIARVVHRYGSLLLVDEAHGAHFPFSDRFPRSAISQGADIVIQSVHKTLPCMTQTALLHVCSERVDLERLEFFLQIYQSSSPSYVLLSSIDEGIRYMERFGRRSLEELNQKLEKFYSSVRDLKHLQVIGAEWKGKCAIIERDLSKILIFTGKSGRTGSWLADRLRRDYQLEVEMEQEQYVLAFMTLMDTEEGFSRLERALKALDAELDDTEDVFGERGQCSYENNPICLRVQEAVYANKKRVTWAEAEDGICAEFVYVYPPGIPILVPGERILPVVAAQIARMKERGLRLEGMSDKSGESIEIVCEE
ncbi:MAG: PLP-dependent transferase [bacterium]|nr:PLP-dependent transferase [bacterium]